MEEQFWGALCCWRHPLRGSSWTLPRAGFSPRGPMALPLRMTVKERHLQPAQRSARADSRNVLSSLRGSALWGKVSPWSRRRERLASAGKQATEPGPGVGLESETPESESRLGGARPVLAWTTRGSRGRDRAALQPPCTQQKGGTKEEKEGSSRNPYAAGARPFGPIPAVRTASSQLPETGVRESGCEVLTGEGRASSSAPGRRADSIHVCWFQSV